MWVTTGAFAKLVSNFDTLIANTESLGSEKSMQMKQQNSTEHSSVDS